MKIFFFLHAFIEVFLRVLDLYLCRSHITICFLDTLLQLDQFLLKVSNPSFGGLACLALEFQELLDRLNLHTHRFGILPCLCDQCGEWIALGICLRSLWWLFCFIATVLCRFRLLFCSCFLLFWRFLF